MTLVHTFKSETLAAQVVQKDGKNAIKYNAERVLQHFLNQCKAGDYLSITITNKKPKRTTNQNNYYWMYLSLIAESTGHDVDDLHTFFKGKFLGTQIVIVYGQKVRRTKSTTSLSVSEFAEYIMRIEELTGVPAPDPQEWQLGPLK